MLEDLVLAEREEAFEDILADREAKDELLPREAWSVKECCKPLWIVSSEFKRVLCLEQALTFGRSIRASKRDDMAAQRSPECIYG